MDGYFWTSIFLNGGISHELEKKTYHGLAMISGKAQLN
jgi:hypothetical protein